MTDTGERGGGTDGGALLFRPLAIRDIRAPNRIMVSPMATYAAQEGMADDFHLVHLGRFALGGAGIVFTEVAAVERRGRSGHGDLGLWSDHHVAPLRRVAEFLKDCGAIPGIQLGHAGRKASLRFPWHGGMPLAADEGPWTGVGPMAEPAAPGWPAPQALSGAEIADLVRCWGDAARRADAAGFEVIEVHAAHGYLLHSFLSPLSNRREDRYGGSLRNRCRLLQEVVTAIRRVWPAGKPLFVRLSAVDGVEGGWSMEDTLTLCGLLSGLGVDAIDCSSGGISADRATGARLPRGYGMHVSFSRRIKAESGLLAVAVGLIVAPGQAEAILRAEEADIIALGREMLADPNWPHRTRTLLEGREADTAAGGGTPGNFGWWLDRRARLLGQLARDGQAGPG